MEYAIAWDFGSGRIEYILSPVIINDPGGILLDIVNRLEEE